MMARRQTKKGEGHAHSKNIQDHDRMDLTPEGKAMWKFLVWADLRPQASYYDDLPPAARMAVDAVYAAAEKLSVLREE